MDDLPSILKGVDIFALLEIRVDEDVDPEESKRNLRRSFLQKARKFHPDKQRKGDARDEQGDLNFVLLKAAFDYLQAKNNFALLYAKALSELRAKRRRLERSKHIASKQATYLESLLRREREASERREEQEGPGPGERRRGYEEYYDEFWGAAPAPREADPSLGQLIVAAKTLDIANGSELNCLLLSSHFPALFDNYGLVSVEPVEVLEAGVERNVKIGKIYFRSEEHAVRALLHYRSNRAKFRCDLYALALGRDEPAVARLDPNEAFEKYEAAVLRRFRALLGS